MVTKVVLKDKSAAAVKANKQAKNERRKNKSKLNAAAKRAYKTMTQQEKHTHLERQVFTRAMRHGATEAEAKKAVAAYKKRRRQRLAGKHAAGKTTAARVAQREVRENIRKQSSAVRDAHRAALQKIKSAGGTPAQRSKMRQAEKKRYANDRSKLASLRKKAVSKHKTLLGSIKKKGGGAFRLQDFISNYSKTPLSRKGKRLKTVDPKKALGDIASKHFAVKGKSGAVKKPRKAKTAPAAAAPAAAAPAVKLNKDGTPAKKRGRKPKAAAAPAAAAPAAEAPKKRGRPKKAAAPAAPVAEAPKKRGRPKKVVAEAPAEAPKKTRGRPKGSTNKPKAPAAVAEKAAKAPAKAAAKKAAKPVAEKAAKAVAKPAAKKAAKEAAKPVAKKAATKAAKAPAKAEAKKTATKVAKETATKVAKAATKGKAVPAKTGGAKPKNKRATLS